MSEYHSQLVEIIRDKSLQFGAFTLSSGQKSPYYIDCRKTTMSAAGMRLIGLLGLMRIRELGWGSEAVGGLTLGADPVSYAIAMASNEAPPVVNAFTVRKQAKTHGTAAAIEGCLPESGPVVVVEDVITTGASAIKAIGAVREAGVVVSGVLALVDRESGGRHAIEAEDCPVTSLVTLSELGVDRG